MTHISIHLYKAERYSLMVMSNYGKLYLKGSIKHDPPLLYIQYEGDRLGDRLGGQSLTLE